MKSKLIGLTVCLMMVIVPFSADAFAAEGLPVVRIGIVKDGPWARHKEIVSVFRQEIKRINSDEYDVRFPPEYSLNGNWTNQGIKGAIDRLMSDRDVDMVVALGLVASHEITHRKDFSKPVVAPFIIDAKLQKLPQKDGTSGIPNLNYIDTLKSLRRDIKVFREIVPFSHLTVFVDGLFLRTVPELSVLVRESAKELVDEVSLLPVETSLEEAVQNMPPLTDAVMITPLLRVTDDDFRKFVKTLSDRNLPSFSNWSRAEVEQGILASLSHAMAVDYLARTVAVNIYDILRGEPAGSLNVVFKPGEQFTINMETARAIGFYPSLSILTEAELLNEARQDIRRMLTLETAVQQAVAANLDLATAQKVVSAGEQAVFEARSALLPQLGIGSDAVMIDDSSAAAGGGVSPEKVWTGSITGSQLLYSEDAWSGYSVEKHFQDYRIEGRETVKLDIIQAAATAYLNVLRARTIERIFKDDLRLTRANLERARVRVSVGIAGPEEVYRWESFIANSRRAVLDAEAATLTAMNILNRLLNRPLQEAFIADETELDDPLLAVSSQLYYQLVNNPMNLRLFRNFMVKEGLQLSPELRRLKAEIAARERILLSAKRAFWLPTVSLRGDVTEIFDESGAGKRSDSIIGIDETDWSVGVFATFPLFTSGKKTAALRRNREELSRLNITYAATAERIEENIMRAINRTRSSYPGIQLSRDAAAASNKNLKLVTDSYERGIKSIIDLIDAQTVALQANQQADNAVYNFLIDLMNVQRAVGRFDFFLSQEEQRAWRQRFEAFAREASLSVSMNGKNGFEKQ